MWLTSADFSSGRGQPVPGNLAVFRGRTGDRAGAVAALQEVVAAMERVLGPNHPTTRANATNLGYWRRILEEYT
jgi:hypothetical protein